MILKAVCDAENPELFELFRKRFNQEDIFVSYFRGSSFKNYYDGRSGNSRFFNMKAYRRPEEDNGLVGVQEVSHMG